MPETDSCKIEIQKVYDQLIKYAEDLHTAINLLKKSHLDLEKAYIDTISRLAQAVEYKDEATGHHVLRIRFFSALLADSFGLPSEQVLTIYNSAAMHDVGKISIPDAILLKPGPLTTEEFTIMQTHTTMGAQLLANSKSSLLETGRIIALHHHERWDGKGYPAGLAGEDIPIEGRIVALADTYDALRSERSYKKRYSLEKTLSILSDGSGNHFDPQLVDAFFTTLHRIKYVDTVLRKTEQQDANALFAELLPECDAKRYASVTTIL